MNNFASAPSTWARGLGYAGLLPFVGLGLAVWLVSPEKRDLATSALLAYGASILTFVGALHWGMTMREPSGPSTSALVWGVVPSLTAWVAVLLSAFYGLILVGLLLCVCLLVDRKVYPGLGLSGWLPMRLHLTAVAGMCCLASAAKLA
jgi:hypothetical protein